MNSTYKNPPVVLRPYQGELLYSWLARTAALYQISAHELFNLSDSDWDWELCVAPSTLVLGRLAEMTRLPSEMLQQLTVSGSGVAQSWWNIRQITPHPLFPKLEYQYRPVLKFCRLCLWDDLVSEGNEFLRSEWMLSVPTICPVHMAPMEDRCETCFSHNFPVFARTSRGFRLLCAGCARPLAGQERANPTWLPQLIVLQSFELALPRSLRNEWSGYFPAAAAGPQFFLRAVEDLLWLLLTSPVVATFDQFFVHWLNETVIRMPSRLDRKPGARPWLGDFGINTRRGLISHLAVLLGGNTIVQRLTRYGSRDAFEKALKTLGPMEAKEFKRRSARWPQMLKNLIFAPQSKSG